MSFIAWGLVGVVGLIVGALWLAAANRQLDRLTLTDLTDDTYADWSLDIADQASDQDFRLWTSELWNDMNAKETES